MLTIRQYEYTDYDVCRGHLWVQLTEQHREIDAEVSGVSVKV